jgi:hypothetical protein
VKTNSFKNRAEVEANKYLGQFWRNDVGRVKRGVSFIGHGYYISGR